MKNFVLHRINFSNFLSFDSDCTMSFVLDGKNAYSCEGFKSSANDGICLSPISVVAGEDRSRINFLNAINFLNLIFNGDEVAALSSCYGLLSPLVVLDGNFSLEFEMDKVLYRYVLDFEEGQVVYESLHQKREKLYSYIFVREADMVSLKYEIKVKNFGVAEKRLRHVNNKLSLIYVGAQQGIQVAKNIARSFLLMSGAGGVNSLPDIVPRQVLDAASVFYGNDSLRKKMVDFLVARGFDLCDVQIRRCKFIGQGGAQIVCHVPDILRHRKDESGAYSSSPIWLEDRRFMAVFVQLSVLLPILQKGGVVCMDGMDALVEPEILNSHLDMFVNPESNKKNAQIILATRSIDVLGGVHPSQAYIANRVFV